MSTMNSVHQNSCNTVLPRDMFCLRNISVDTIHKGDTDDDDDNINNNMAIHFVTINTTF
jgi:hypothetical protein